MQFTVSRKRHQFCRPVTYTDGTGLETVDIVSQPEPEGEAPLVTLELETGVQAVQETMEASCQTERYTYVLLRFLFYVFLLRY